MLLSGLLGLLVLFQQISKKKSNLKYSQLFKINNHKPNHIQYPIISKQPSHSPQYFISTHPTMKKIITSSHLQKLLEHKYDILNEFKKIHYDQFCKYLTKVKALDQVNAYKVNGISNHLNRMAIFHHRPIDEIVYTYQKTYFKGFDQDIIAMNIKTLGSIFESFQKDGMLYSGFENTKEVMFFEDRFDNVMNEARFAFQENTYVNNKNLGHIVQGLTKIGYIEREFLELIMEKLSLIANDNESSEIDPSKRYYQMNRRYYYAQGELINRNKLLKSESFNSILEEILNDGELMKSRERKQVNGQEENKTAVKQNEQSQISVAEQDEHKIQQLISSIAQQLDQTSQNLSEFVQSIISLRLKYVDMVTATSNKYIISDPNLNTQLLELEESLLQFKLIKLQQIKDPSITRDKDKFLKNSKDVIFEYLNNPQENMSKYLELILEKYNTVKVNSVKVPSNINNEVLYFGRLIQDLSEYVNAQTKEIRRDGLIHSKWKASILDKSYVAPKHVRQFLYDEHYYNLNVDRGFKNVYQLFVKYMKERGLEEHRKYVKKATDPLNGISYVKGLIDLGFAEEGLNLLRELNIFDAKLIKEGKNHYSREHIIDLVSVISTFSELDEFKELNSQLYLVIEDYVKKDRFLQTKWKVAEGGTGWGIYELCTVINWMENTSNTENTLFELLQSLLKQQTEDISLLSSHRYHGMIASVLTPGETVPGSNYDTLRLYNPAMLLVKQKILKHLGVLNSQDLMDQELIPYGYMDIENELLHHLVFVPTVMSSMDGKYINHNLKGHYRRLERVKKMKVTPIPFTKLVNYSQSEQEYHMKSPKELQSIISQITMSGELSEVTMQITNLLTKIKQHFKSEDVVTHQSTRDKKAFHKILSTIGEIRNHISRGKKIQNINVNKINRHKVVYAILRLKKEFGYLSDGVKKQIDTNQVNDSLDRVVGRISSKNDSKHTPKSSIFSGKRQTIDTLDQMEQANTPHQKSQIDFTNYILDLDFLQNEKYHQYDDWREEIQAALGVYNAGELAVEDCSDLTKLVMHGKSTLAIPVYHPRRIITPPYLLSWDKIYKQSSKKELETALEIERLVKEQEAWKSEEEIAPEVGMKIALQNLKCELKYDKTKKEVVDLLLEFDFIDNLIAQHLEHAESNTSPQSDNDGLLTRDPKCYFQHLSQRPYDHILSSPYLSYVFSKINKKQTLKQLLLSNKNKSRQLLRKARLNEITPGEFSKQVETMHKAAMKEIQSYKSQILDEQFVVMAHDTRLIVTPTVNEEELSRLLMMQLNLYNVDEDADMILGNGEYSLALERKRYKEEQKLIKLRILLKKVRKMKLSENEEKYLRQWTQRGNEENTDSYHFTNKRISDLSEKDKKVLDGFHYSNDIVNKYQEQLRLSDLILQLGHSYSNSAVTQFEGRLLLKKCQQKYLKSQTPGLEFTSSFNSPFDINQNLIVSNYLLELQRAKFDQQSKLNVQDINNIVEISRYLKVETPDSLVQYNHIYSGIEDQLNELNKLPNRNQAISEWYRIKEEEFDFSVKVGDQVRGKKREEIQTVWKELVGKGIEESNSHEISKLVHTLCERMFMLRKNCPPYFSNLVSAILTHPQLNYPDKCVLLGSLELTKFPLTIDSDDILRLARSGASEMESADEIKKKIRLVQNRFSAEQAAYVYV